MKVTKLTKDEKALIDKQIEILLNTSEILKAQKSKIENDLEEVYVWLKILRGK